MSTVFNSLQIATLAAFLTGCGLTQSVADSTTATTKAIFYKPLKTLHLDLSGRTAMNRDETNMTALSVPTLVRVYQLRDIRAFERVSYDRLLGDDDSALIADLLDKQAVVIKPEEGAQLNVPLNEQAKFIAVVALFREPDSRSHSWRVTLTRDDLDPERARVIELGDNRLVLRPLAKE